MRHCSRIAFNQSRSVSSWSFSVARPDLWRASSLTEPRSAAPRSRTSARISSRTDSTTRFVQFISQFDVLRTRQLERNVDLPDKVKLFLTPKKFNQENCRVANPELQNNLYVTVFKTKPSKGLKNRTNLQIFVFPIYADLSIPHQAGEFNRPGYFSSLQTQKLSTDLLLRLKKRDRETRERERPLF